MITDLDMDGVTIAGTRVPRPSRISVSQWYDYWEKILYPKKRWWS